MTQTNRLGLPYLAAAQSQKHVTHNDALQMLDGLVQIAVRERNRAAPPATPAEGDRYLVAAAPTGGFAGQGGRLAAFDDGAWRFYTPRQGWIVYVAADDALAAFDGAAWRDVGSFVRSLSNLVAFGVGTTPDAANPFSAKLNAMLIAAKGTNEGGTGDLRVTLNKQGTARTVSQLYQSNWSGRAETGLAGDDAFRLKVSPDGSAWRDSLVADPSTGAVRLPSGLSDIGGGALAFRNHLVNGDFAIAQRGAGPFALAGAATPAFGFDRWLIQHQGGAGATLARTPALVGSTDFSGRYFASFAVSALAATSYPEVQTRIEDVNRFAGRLITVSFLYRTASAAFFCDLAQNFGSGGSPSVFSIGQTALPASPGWSRRAVRVALPTAGGKTVGAGSFLAFRVFLSGAAPASIDLADVQIEEGPVATPYERRPLPIELLLCRRFFRRSTTALNTADLALEMAATPTASGTGPFTYAAEL